jgi:hypothetical protein
MRLDFKRTLGPALAGPSRLSRTVMACLLPTLLPIAFGQIALTSELTSWFSGLSLAGFEATLYGRFWVTPEALSFRALQGPKLKCR